MPRTPYYIKHPIPGIKGRYVRAGMDVNFIKRNWAGLNETPIKKAGLLIRKIMRGSIRRKPEVSAKTGRRLKPSKPGRPPLARTGLGTKTPPFKNILSAPDYEPGKGVIGHVRLPIKKQDPNITPMRAHEFGETVTIKSVKKLTRGKRAKTPKQRRAARKKYLQGKIQHKGKTTLITRQVDMPKRPFAKPALERAKSRIGQFWRGIIKRSTIRK